MRVSRRPSRLLPPKATAVLLAVLFAMPGSALGAPALAQGEVAQSSDALREEQDAIEAELDAARDAREGIAGELDEAAADREAVEDALTEATARVDDLLQQLDEVRGRQSALREDVGRLQGEADAVRGSLGATIRSLYKQQSTRDPLVMAINSGSASEAGARAHYLTALSRDDRAQLEELGNIVSTLEARTDELARVDDELQVLREDAEVAQAELDTQLFLAAGVESEVAERLVTAEAEARRLAVEADRAAAAVEEAEEAERAAAAAAAAEAERQAQEAAQAASTAAAAATSSAGGGSGSAPVSTSGSTSGKACPQDHPRSFTDTWGAPRSGGRRHQGTDIFGARGGDVFAIVDGTVAFTRNSGISGLFLSLAGDDGNTYYYIHLQDFVASAGDRVSAGQLIAHNGDTGNARGTTPHIHFELHPGGGAAVNPYPMLRAICG